MSEHKKATTQVSATPKPPDRALDAIHTFAGDVLWVKVPLQHVAGHEQGHTRPWVVFSENTALHRRELDLVYAVPLTTEVDKYKGWREARIIVPTSEMTVIDQRWKPGVVPGADRARALHLDGACRLPRCDDVSEDRQLHSRSAPIPGQADASSAIWNHPGRVGGLDQGRRSEVHDPR